VQLSASRLIDPRGAVLRVVVSMMTGSLAAALATWRGVSLPLLFGWNVAGATMLLLAWLLIAHSDEKMTQERAGAEDPGRTLVYAIVLVASLVSLLAAFQLTRHVGSMPQDVAGSAELMCLVTVALAWGMTHTAFTLRYAHLYYREDDQGIGGVEFPEKCTPSYFDFAYFAFTIGMCFQTSDVCVTNSSIRRAVLLHAVISFGYNTAIIAFVLNLVFGKMS
jgi:uncharacterized membrane protein